MAAVLLADDVPDRHPEAAAGERDDVEPVTSHLAVSTCAVAVIGLDSRDLGQAVREQVALELERGAALVLVQADVLDRHGRHVGELDHDRLVVLRELALPLARQLNQAERTSASLDQRRDEPSASTHRSGGAVAAVGCHAHRRAVGADDRARPLP